MSGKIKLKIAIKPKKTMTHKTVVSIDDLANVSFPKPILKWVGGKSQILEKLITLFPREMNNYHEVFLGGGSVLLALLILYKKGVIIIKGKVYAYDSNKPLIAIYQNIQKNHEELYACLQNYIQEYNSVDPASTNVNRKPTTLDEAKSSRESYYYWIRSKYNALSDEDKISVLGSSLFIFLNKTGFRGMFRLGPNGFNVPYGNYANPQIIESEHLDTIHELIQNVVFRCQDFSDSLANIGENDFVYLDPPYVPTDSKSFVKYTETGFNLENHQKLFGMLSDLKCCFLLSNADVELVRNHFDGGKFMIDSLICKRAINSKKPQSTAGEVLIRNYV